MSQSQTMWNESKIFRYANNMGLPYLSLSFPISPFVFFFIPSLPFLLLIALYSSASKMWIPIFLLFHLWSIALSVSDSVNMEACAPAKCGSVDISYPFWISKTQPEYCGYPSLEINCQDDKPFLVQSYDTNYYIDRVFYDNSSFLLIDSILVNENTNCSLPRFNVSLGLSPMVVSETNKELVFFFNCERKDPLPVDLLRVNCGGNQSDAANESFVRLLPNYSDDPGASGESLSNCRISRIPVSGWKGSTVDQYTTLMNDGFLVELKVASCSDCRKSNGQCGFNTTTSMFMCICPDNTHPMSCLNAKTNKDSQKRTISIGIAVGSLAFILVCLILILKFRSSKNCAKCILWSKDKPQGNIKMLLEKNGLLAPKTYKYAEVKKFTCSFQDTLGKGGFGTVYRGKLQDGRLVAVKILHNSSNDREELLNEILSIARTSHVNVVSLLGFCIEGSKHALIYEYMPNGSLDNYIYSENPKAVIGWEKLNEIAIGIGRGLEYLHRGCNARIVHFDIKPQNILLDEDFNPKIADFGLAKLCPPKESILSMAEMRGTIGYIAPEVFSRSFGVVSTKSDVYSYGMMVLEMVGGRSNAKPSAENPSQVYFPHWLYDRLVEGSSLQACDVSIETEEIAKKMGIIGLWCTQTMPANWPSMNKVVEMLEKSLDELEMPPKPYLCSPPHSKILSDSYYTPKFALNSESDSDCLVWANTL